MQLYADFASELSENIQNIKGANMYFFCYSKS